MMHDDGWGKWFRDSLDKFLLTGLFCGQVTLVVWMIRQQTDQGYVNWAQNLASTVLGTLLGLITGKLLTRTDQSTNTAITQAPGGGDLDVKTTLTPPIIHDKENPITGKEI